MCVCVCVCVIYEQYIYIDIYIYTYAYTCTPIKLTIHYVPIAYSRYNEQKKKNIDTSRIKKTDLIRIHRCWGRNMFSMKKEQKTRKMLFFLLIAMSFQLLSDFYPLYDERKEKNGDGTRPYVDWPTLANVLLLIIRYICRKIWCEQHL